MELMDPLISRMLANTLAIETVTSGRKGATNGRHKSQQPTRIQRWVFGGEVHVAIALAGERTRAVPAFEAIFDGHILARRPWHCRRKFDTGT